jgi:hypothetical protein
MVFPHGNSVDLFYHDPAELVKQLLSNPDFNNPDIMAYEPKEIYSRNGAEAPFEREYGEAFTGDWWNTVQVRV